jgi:2-dehydro-3-deoxyglucarate aldolase/4-hydroxy-2-oxoheptanedioate aldolase
VKENAVKRSLAGGGTAVGAFLSEFNTTGIPRVLAAAGAEFALFDQEHTGWSVEALRPVIATARAHGVVPIVRVPAAQKNLIAAVLDAGALGVMVPMVASAEQAREIVAASKFPPDGRRGVGPMYADELDDDLLSTLARINRELLVIAMIETEEGLENVEEIAAVEGVDILWIGHFDLTCSLGIPARFDEPRYLDALDRIQAAAEAGGKAIGMLAMSPEEGQRLARRGFRCVAFGDAGVYAQALRTAFAQVRG